MLRLHPRFRQFVFGVTAGLTAQGLRAFVRWLRAPATGAAGAADPPAPRPALAGGGGARRRRVGGAGGAGGRRAQPAHEGP